MISRSFAKIATASIRTSASALPGAGTSFVVSESCSGSSSTQAFISVGTRMCSDRVTFCQVLGALETKSFTILHILVAQFFLLFTHLSVDSKLLIKETTIHKGLDLLGVQPIVINGEILQDLRNWLNVSNRSEGERLPAERLLAEQPTVSRADLRKALLVLDSEGWLERHAGRGAFIKNTSNPGLADSAKLTLLAQRTGPHDAMTARLALEPEVASLAALRAKQ